MSKSLLGDVWDGWLNLGAWRNNQSDFPEGKSKVEHNEYLYKVEYVFNTLISPLDLWRLNDFTQINFSSSLVDIHLCHHESLGEIFLLNLFIQLIYICMKIIIYIYCHPHTDCFVVLQLFRAARHVGRLKLESKPAQLYVRLSIRLLGQQAYYVS